MNCSTCPVLQSFIASVKTATVKTTTYVVDQDIIIRQNITCDEQALFQNVQD